RILVDGERRRRERLFDGGIHRHQLAVEVVRAIGDRTRGRRNGRPLARLLLALRLLSLRLLTLRLLTLGLLALRLTGRLSALSLRRSTLSLPALRLRGRLLLRGRGRYPECNGSRNRQAAESRVHVHATHCRGRRCGWVDRNVADVQELSAIVIFGRLSPPSSAK